MLVQTAFSLALIAGASAQSTVSLFMPYDTQSMVAAVVGKDATATTYALACTNADSEDCGVPGDFTIVQGASTMGYVISAPGHYMSMGCKIESDVADCSASVSPTFTDGSVTKTTVSGISSYYQAVVVTTSLPTGAAATTGATPAANTATPTGTAATSGFSTATSSSKKTSATSGASASGASASGAKQSASSSSSTGGVPQITGNARWAVGGAAMALALAVV